MVLILVQRIDIMKYADNYFNILDRIEVTPVFGYFHHIFSAWAKGDQSRNNYGDIDTPHRLPDRIEKIMPKYTRTGTPVPERQGEKVVPFIREFQSMLVSP